MNDFVERIKSLIKQNKFRLSEHADREGENDGLTIADLRKVFDKAVLIEDYPKDKRGHSCLILGFDSFQRPVHIVSGIDSNNILVMITVYIPTMPKWKSPKERNK